MNSPHVHVLVSGDRLPGVLIRAISRLGASASFARLNDAIRTGARSCADAVVIVEATEAHHEAITQAQLRRIVGPRCGALIVSESPPRNRATSPIESIDVSADPEESHLAGRIARLIDRTTRATAAIADAAPTNTP